MTAKELNNKDIPDSLKETILRKATALNNQYGTDLKDGIRIMYNAYAVSSFDD